MPRGQLCMTSTSKIFFFRKIIKRRDQRKEPNFRSDKPSKQFSCFFPWITIRTDHYRYCDLISIVSCNNFISHIFYQSQICFYVVTNNGVANNQELLEEEVLNIYISLVNVTNKMIFSYLNFVCVYKLFCQPDIILLMGELRSYFGRDEWFIA